MGMFSSSESIFEPFDSKGSYWTFFVLLATFAHAVLAAVSISGAKFGS